MQNSNLESQAFEEGDSEDETMKTKFRVRLLLTVLQVLFLMPATPARNNQRDGNWWLAQTEGLKVGYMVGFLDGIALGRNFASWQFMDDPQSEACLKKVLLSSIEYEKKYLSNVKVGQLVDGLNDFYSDYRNRGIAIDRAVWLVLNGIAGTPKEKVERMIEAARKNAIQ